MECSTRWGLEVEAEHKLRGHPIGSVVQIGAREFMCITQRDIVRFELSRVIDIYPFHLMSLVAIRELGIVVGVTATNPEFWVFQCDNMKNPVKTGVKVEDASVFNMAYSAKSKVLITFGECIKCWNFEYSAPRRAYFDPPTVSIRFKNVVTRTASSIMNPPVLEQKRERLLIQEGGGLQSYSLRGTVMDTLVRLQSQATTGYYERSRKLLTSNSEQGVVLWNEFGMSSKRFVSLGLDASLAIRFLNGEFAVLLDAKGSLTILDVKTSRVYYGYQYEKPVNRLFVFNDPYPRIVACTESGVTVLKAVLPWKLWTSAISKPVFMKRCPKLKEPARMMVLCANSHVMLLSPANARTLTAITLQTTSKAITHFYDRGTEDLPELKRDQIMLPLQDGTMPVYSTGQNPCERVSTIDMKILSMALVNYRDKPCFCFGTSMGNIMYYDYETLSPKGRSVVSQYPIVRICYHKDSDSLLLVFADRVLQWKIKDEKIIGQMNFTPSSVYMELDDVYVFGYGDGTIQSLCVKDGLVASHETSSLRLHDDEITGFSRGSTFFVTSSVDSSVRVWSNDFMLIHQVILPLPLGACAVLNGKRHILVSTDAEIMFIDGRLIFGGEVDEEDEKYDNYDRLRDALDNQTTAFDDDKEEEESGETLLVAKDAPESEPEEAEREPKRPKARGRYMTFAQSLRKHNELAKAISEQKAKEGPETSSAAAANAQSNEEKKRKLQEMMAITAGQSPKKSAPPPPQPYALPPRPTESIELSKPQDTEGQQDAEGETEEEYEDDESSGSATTQKGKQTKRVSNTTETEQKEKAKTKQGVAKAANPAEQRETKTKSSSALEKQAPTKREEKPATSRQETQKSQAKPEQETDAVNKGKAKKEHETDKSEKKQMETSTKSKPKQTHEATMKNEEKGSAESGKVKTSTGQTKDTKEKESKESYEKPKQKEKVEKKESAKNEGKAESALEESKERKHRVRTESAKNEGKAESSLAESKERKHKDRTESEKNEEKKHSEGKKDEPKKSVRERAHQSDKQAPKAQEGKDPAKNVARERKDTSRASSESPSKHSGSDVNKHKTERQKGTLESNPEKENTQKERSKTSVRHKSTDKHDKNGSKSHREEPSARSSTTFSRKKHQMKELKHNDGSVPEIKPQCKINRPSYEAEPFKRPSARGSVKEIRTWVPRAFRDYEQKLAAAQSNKAMISKPIVRLARRVPTPIRRPAPIPCCSTLFARSVRPKTPPKRTGLIVNHLAAPVNVVLDMEMVRLILESNDERFAALAAQLRPWVRYQELSNSYNVSVTYRVKPRAELQSQAPSPVAAAQFQELSQRLHQREIDMHATKLDTPARQDPAPVQTDIVDEGRVGEDGEPITIINHPSPRLALPIRSYEQGDAPPPPEPLAPLEHIQPIGSARHDEYVSQSARSRMLRPFFAYPRQRRPIVKPPVSTRSLYVRGHVLKTHR